MMDNYLHTLFGFKKQAKIQNMENDEHSGDSENISLLYLFTSYTAAFFLCPLTSNMLSNLDGHSNSMGTWWRCIT